MVIPSCLITMEQGTHMQSYLIHAFRILNRTKLMWEELSLYRTTRFGAYCFVNTRKLTNKRGDHADAPTRIRFFLLPIYDAPILMSIQQRLYD